MPLKFVLQDTLDRHGITQYALSKASGVRMNSVQDIRLGVSKALTVSSLDAIIAAVNSLSGETYGIEAVIVYEEDSDWKPVEDVKPNRSMR